MEYKYRGAYVLVAIHDEQLRRFLETWRAAKVSKTSLPAVEDPDYASYGALLHHVFRWARTYLIWACERLDLPEPSIAMVPDVVVIEGEAENYLEQLLAAWKIPFRDVDPVRFFKPEHVAPWGVKYCIDSMLEHAAMHALRHRFQLEELMRKRPGVSPDR